MARYVVNLQRDFDDAVKHAAERTGLSKEGVILRALATYVAEDYAQEMPKQPESEAVTGQALAATTNR